MALPEQALASGRQMGQKGAAETTFVFSPLGSLPAFPPPAFALEAKACQEMCGSDTASGYGWYGHQGSAEEYPSPL